GFRPRKVARVAIEATPMKSQAGAARASVDPDGGTPHVPLVTAPGIAAATLPHGTDRGLTALGGSVDGNFVHATIRAVLFDLSRPADGAEHAGIRNSHVLP